MGMSFSSEPPSPSFSSIRVVHLDGYIEDFYEPTTAKEITIHYPKHCLCTKAQLFPNSKQLQLGTQLQRGTPYFLLPFSLFQSDASSVANLVSIGKRLTAIANGRKAPTGRSVHIGSTVGLVVLSDDQKSIISKGGVVVISDHQKSSLKAYKEQQFWKPRLDSIEEKSMEYGCGSDLNNMIVRSSWLS